MEGGRRMEHRPGCRRTHFVITAALKSKDVSFPLTQALSHREREIVSQSSNEPRPAIGSSAGSGIALSLRERAGVRGKGAFAFQKRKHAIFHFLSSLFLIFF